jgi:thioredoxin reductase (NADPH)
MRENYDVVIIGAGPAGLTAGIYAARGGMNVAILERTSPGGQAVITDLVENYPGFPDGISGFELAERVRSQAESFGAEIATAEVVKIEDNAATEGKIIRTAEGSAISALAVIIATGAVYRTLGIPGEGKLLGRGVSTCATCDAPLYRDKHVVVVGGGNTAIQESLFLAKFVSKLTLVHRRDRLRAAKVLQDRIFKLGPKVEFRWNSIAAEITGEATVSGVSIENVQTGEKETIACDGVFIFVGFTPNSEFARGYVDTDESGYIITNEKMATSVEGVFACGDVRKSPLKQVVAACGEGAVAAFSAQRYVDDKKGTTYP